MHQRTNKQTIWDRYAVSSRQETQPPPPQPNSGVIGLFFKIKSNLKLLKDLQHRKVSLKVSRSMFHFGSVC